MLKPLAPSLLGLAILQTLSGVCMAQTAPSKDDSAYYIVTHRDFRKCAYPMCGGYFVKAVNKTKTQCADGSLQDECHVLELNAKAIGWSDDDLAKFTGPFSQGYALVRGTLQQQPLNGLSTDTLKLTEGWVGQAQHAPTGGFFGLQGNGLVCITYPCASINERKLNTSSKQAIAGVDLAASGAREDQLAQGNMALYNSGILAAGKNKIITGPAGWGQQFTASEFYLPVVVVKKP